ncbi:hypothetical protein Tco_1110831 [Tanacetum coccineum]|uniref:Uncharacterized protein n=1 Tax=Tanacetum coccineum TaxID=301880 RepID=A0ABQ5IMD6_9ASTR
MAFIHLILKKDVVLMKGFNKVECWTFYISLQSFFSCSSQVNPLDERPNIIRLPLKLFFFGNFKRCGVCICPLRHSFILLELSSVDCQNVLFRESDRASKMSSPSISCRQRSAIQLIGESWMLFGAVASDSLASLNFVISFRRS